MNEAIDELKENEFKDLYENEDSGVEKEYVKDLQIDTDFELLFSDEYINNVTERLSLYNELGNVTNEEELVVFQNKLIDRFGPMPPRALALMNSIRIKWIATRVGIEKLVMKKGKMIGYFVADQQSDFYTSKRFQQMLQFVQKNSSICVMKEKQTPAGLRLLLTFDNVKTTRRALELMEMLGK
jgi:transcription-repair coupling factor (superfamily II helicase)